MDLIQLILFPQKLIALKYLLVSEIIFIKVIYSNFFYFYFLLLSFCLLKEIQIVIKIIQFILKLTINALNKLQDKQKDNI